MIRRIAKVVSIIIIIHLLFSSFISTLGVTNQEEINILLIYGNEDDLEFGNQLASVSGINTDPINITTLSDRIENLSCLEYNAIWWFVSVESPISLNIFKSNENCSLDNKGIFVMSSNLESLYYDNGDKLGIKYLNNFKIPSIKTENFELRINENTKEYFENSSIPDFLSVETQASLIIPSSKMLQIAEFILPKIPQTSSLSSGVYLSSSKNEKIVLATFQTPDLRNPEIIEKIGNSNPHMKTQQEDDILLLFEQLAHFSTTSSSGGSNPLEISFDDLDLSDVALPIAILVSILSFGVLWFLGLSSIIKSLLFAIFATFLTIIYHLYYTPSSRRLTKYDMTTNEVRLSIINFLEEKATVGAHLREIQRNVNCGISSLLWHLQLLEDFNLIMKRKVGRYHIYYDSNINISLDQQSLSIALRSKVAKRIWEILDNSKKPLRLSEISKKAKCHHETVRYHIKRFIELKLITTIQEGKKTLYLASIAKVVQYQEEDLGSVSSER